MSKTTVNQVSQLFNCTHQLSGKIYNVRIKSFRFTFNKVDRKGLVRLKVCRDFQRMQLRDCLKLDSVSNSDPPFLPHCMCVLLMGLTTLKFHLAGLSPRITTVTHKTGGASLLETTTRIVSQQARECHDVWHPQYQSHRCQCSLAGLFLNGVRTVSQS